MAAKPQLTIKQKCVKLGVGGGEELKLFVGKEIPLLVLRNSAGVAVSTSPCFIEVLI